MDNIRQVRFQACIFGRSTSSWAQIAWLNGRTVDHGGALRVGEESGGTDYACCVPPLLWIRCGVFCSSQFLSVGQRVYGDSSPVALAGARAFVRVVRSIFFPAWRQRCHPCPFALRCALGGKYFLLGRLLESFWPGVLALCGICTLT